MLQIDDHPLRFKVANELHTRPFPIMEAPCTAAFIALKQKGDAATRDPEQEFAHLLELLDRHGAPHPQPNATHYYGQIGKNWLKWEQHTEFVTYTVFNDGLDPRPFEDTVFSSFPSDWLANAPGQRVTSVSLRMEKMQERDQISQRIKDWFVPESLAVSSVLDDAAVVAADFRIDPLGHQRFAIFLSAETGGRRLGRIVQRLCEIETYKAMSMLGFSHAQNMGEDLNVLDRQLTDLIGNIGADDAVAEATLDALLGVASELETQSAQGSFRFGATGAYAAIVNQRIAALREERFMGRQSFAEFMMRRYEPAMRTVASTERRLDALSSRSIRAANLLRTRVDVERSAQNQGLLTSMDRRSDQQLQLQRTVEGLSVVAISYYAVSLVAYLLYPLGDVVGLSKGMMTALITLPVVTLVWLMLRRIQRHTIKG
ncbi:MAG: DUF3422 domain-containing protein [Ascidiaceihabitans sp.]|jgi:uncharacterized membrane-anchored protein|nr:DUF3422 domain-containing protein [Ascidiaceihabitans sp.]